MTYEQLQQHILSIHKIGSGHWRVTIEYRGCYYSGTTTNSMAIDRFHNDEVSDRTSRYGYTAKQCLQTLYNDVKRANRLGEYKY